MNFAFTEEQELLRHTAREFIGRECPMTLVRELAESAAGHQPALWKRMAELGWLGLLVPEDYGGAGLGFVDLVVILEEMGRSLLPSPFFANLQGTLAVMHAGSEDQHGRAVAGRSRGPAEPRNIAMFPCFSPEFSQLSRFLKRLAIPMNGMAFPPRGNRSTGFGRHPGSAVAWRPAGRG